METSVKITLMNAVVNGTLDNVQHVFSQYALKLDDSYFDYELLKAALRRERELIANFLIKIGCRVNNPHKKFEETPLHLAMKLINNEITENIIVKTLLNKGASIYAENHNGETPVHAAFKDGNYKSVLTVFYNTRFTFNAVVKKGDVLHFQIACVTNNYEIAEKYLKCKFSSSINPNSPLSLDSEKYCDLTPVEFAIQNNYLMLFETFLKYNADLSRKNSKGLTPMHTIYYSSIENNGKTWIKEALTNGSDTKFINSKDKYGLSHFHLCCMIDGPNFVKSFINEGIDINSAVSLDGPVNPGFTPLHFAAKNGCEKVIKLLIENGADPEIVDKTGKSALHVAFYHMNTEGIWSLNALLSKIQLGPINCTDDHGLSYFHIVCAITDFYSIITFLNSGVNIDSCPTSGIYSGFTALHFAAMFNQKDIVELLLNRNAKVNVKTDVSQVTPLHLACRFNSCTAGNQEEALLKSRLNQLDIIKLLLLHGADVEAKDASGLTPLLYACVFDKDYAILESTNFAGSNVKERIVLIKELSLKLEQIIEILILNKANIHARTKNWSSILHILSKYKALKISEKLVKLLVTSGADVNAVNDAGLTPLHIATEHSNTNFVKRLLKCNANPNVKCKNSRIPLHLVVDKIVNNCDSRAKSKNGIFSALLKSGSDVNVLDFNGGTMLHAAISKYKYTTVKKLLYYGADVNMENKSNDCCVSNIVFKWDTELRQWIPMDYHVHSDFFQLIFIHVQKLLALGLPVNEKIKNCCAELYPGYKKRNRFQLVDLDNVFDNCIKELDEMKNIRIDSYTSLYNILLKDPHDLAKHVKNSRFIKIVKDKKVENAFPLYNYLLKIQFKRGLMRSAVLESAEAALSNILKVDLPGLCNDSIIRYLKNEDIVSLKEAALVKRSLKRKFYEMTSNEIRNNTRKDMMQDRNNQSEEK